MRKVLGAILIVCGFSLFALFYAVRFAGKLSHIAPGLGFEGSGTHGRPLTPTDMAIIIGLGVVFIGLPMIALLYGASIKLHREQTRLGLKEAKDAVEAYLAGRG